MRGKKISSKFVVAGMAVIVLLAVTLRLVLMTFHWPVTTADEAILGLMARHIAYQGDHPIFYWGQNYMGTIQAYLGAGLMRLFGSNAFSVHLGTLLLFTLYLVSLYFLVRTLYTPLYALFIIALLSLGSDRMINVPLTANGGYAETMLFGALIFWLAAWLGLTAARQRAFVSWRRLLVYAALGVAIGMAIWSDELILSAVVAAVVFLLVCCRQEIGVRVIGAFLLGLLVGGLPLILYNFSAPPGQNSLVVLYTIVFSNAPRVIPWPQEVIQTLLISLPIQTGVPLSTGMHMVCGTVEPYLHPISSLAGFFPNSNPWLCLGERGSWCLVILLLWGIAVAGALQALRRLRTPSHKTGDDGNEQVTRQRALISARLMLLGSGALWLLLYSLSANGQWAPQASARYLTCLLLVTPAILWPLWQSIGHVRERVKLRQSLVRSRFVISVSILLVLIVAYLVGIGDVWQNLPGARNDFDHTNVLIQGLLAHKVTRVYSDYATCSLLMFQSNEQIICDVLDDQLHTGQNRYDPYVAIVRATPHAAYFFPTNSPSDQQAAQRLRRNTHYHHTLITNYSLYYYS